MEKTSKFKPVQRYSKTIHDNSEIVPIEDNEINKSFDRYNDSRLDKNTQKLD